MKNFFKNKKGFTRIVDFGDASTSSRSEPKSSSPKFTTGFTLIELLVVVAIIGLLASIVEANLSSSRAKARDAFRKSSLRELQNALELYHTDHNAYPIAQSGGGYLQTSQWFSSEPDDQAPTRDDWIPGLVPKYIASLPEDPRGGAPHPYCGLWKSAFLYASDGTNYKLLSHCAPEGVMSSNDAFYDPTRPYWAWMVTNKTDLPPSGCGDVGNIKWLFGTSYPICW